MKYGYLSFIDPERVGFGEGNIISSGNISPNLLSGGSINDILYRYIIDDILFCKQNTL